MATIKLREPTQEEKDKIVKAAKSDNVQTLEELASHGVDITGIINEQGSTALHWAAQLGADNVIAFLLRHRAEVNAVNKLKWTPLHFAANHDHSDTVSLLVNGGADINMKNVDGMTPLEVAVHAGCSYIVHYFVKTRGMDITKMDEKLQHYASELLKMAEKEKEAEQKHSALEQETIIAKMLHYLFEARKNGHSVKIRYGKVLLCGANAAGKTNFLNLLMEKDFQEKHKSTGVTESRHVKVAFKAVAISEDDKIYFKEISIEDERAELVLHLQPVTDSNNDDHTSSANNTDKKYCTKTEKLMATKQVNVSDKKFGSKLDNKPGKVEEVWNILTFIDTGGQPHLISLLPAVNSFAMTSLIVHNMTESLKANVKIIQDDKVMQQSYGCKHHQLIKTLASYANSVLLPDLQFLNTFKVLNTSNQEKKSTSLSIVGTHSYTMLENDIQKIDNELKKMFEHLQGLMKILKPSLNKNYDYIIPVDNDKQGKKSPNKNASHQISHYTDQKKYTPPSIIRSYLYTQLEKQDVYEVPLNWLILELEIRRKCKEENSILITLTNVLKLGEDKKLGDTDYIISGLKFHHLFGVLLYFEKVEGMEELVITNHQWLFDRLTNFVDYIRNIDFDTQEDKENFKLKGMFKESMIDVDKLDIREDFKKSGVNAEPKKSFLHLLEYLRFIAPHKNPEAEYFMPTLLRSFELASLHEKNIETNNTIFTEPLLLQYRTGDKSGSFPRGFFCFLAVQLKIAKKSDWKVSHKKQAYNNLLTFRNEDSGHHITLIDRIFYLEIQVAHVKEDVSPIHNEVYNDICYALEKIGLKFNVKNQLNYGFLCKACPKSNEVHITYLSSKKGNCKYSYCINDEQTDLTDAHKVWIKESLTKEKEKCTIIKGGVNGSQAKEIISSTIWSKKWIAPRNILAVLILLFAFSMTYITQLYTETSPQRLKTGNSKEYEVFCIYSEKLATVLPTQNMIPKLISAQIITYSDREEIYGLSKSQDKALFVLNLVDKSLKINKKHYFYSLLDIMEEYGGVVTQLSNEIKERLK